MGTLAKLIKNSFCKFQIDLHGKTVLTEAASGNYVCTPVIAAMAGARVFAIAKDSKFGSVYQAQSEVLSVAEELNIKNQISIINSLNGINLGNIDIVTNTGFVRPIDKLLIDQLNPNCVIPLMYEPWEFRPDDIDLDSATCKGIKIYGTNESDSRLQTTKYIGLTVLYFLLKEKRSPFNSNILVIGCDRFNHALEDVLRKLNYSVIHYATTKYNCADVKDFDTIVIAEHTNSKMIIGNSSESLIQSSSLTKEQVVIHISGNVDFNELICKYYPDKPAPFGHMSYTSDFIDPLAVFDLHSAGLKVAEGMIHAKSQNLMSLEYKNFMETKYPALSFVNEKYW